MSERTRRIGRGLAGAALAATAGAGPVMMSTAPADASTSEGFISVVGETVECESGSYTATSGGLRYVIHANENPSGNTQTHGTFRLDDVTVEKNGLTYYASGVNTFTFNYNANSGTFVSIDTEKISIVERGSGLVGRVNAILHVSSDGTVRGFNFGTCEPHAEV